MLVAVELPPLFNEHVGALESLATAVVSTARVVGVALAGDGALCLEWLARVVGAESHALRRTLGGVVLQLTNAGDGASASPVKCAG